MLAFRSSQFRGERTPCMTMSGESFFTLHTLRRRRGSAQNRHTPNVCDGIPGGTIMSAETAHADPTLADDELVPDDVEFEDEQPEPDSRLTPDPPGDE